MASSVVGRQSMVSQVELGTWLALRSVLRGRYTRKIRHLTLGYGLMTRPLIAFQDSRSRLCGVGRELYIQAKSHNARLPPASATASSPTFDPAILLYRLEVQV
jgi:hypothetical protein